MNFTTAARKMENCVVGVVQRFHRDNQQIPTLWGTGFFISEHGVVATCRHVLEHVMSLPLPEGYDEKHDGLPVAVVCWREREKNGVKEWGWFELEVEHLGEATFVGGRPHYVEDEKPDLVFLTLNVRETPSVRLAGQPPEIGEPVAFSGYPMGLRVLLGHAGKGFRQESPTLHAGVVAAINPSRLAASPYHFLVHANTQGGASGSPVFREDASVIGMVYIVIPEYYVGDEDNPANTLYAVPTALTGCIYGPLMAQSANLAHETAAKRGDRPLYADKVRNAIAITTEPGQPVMEPYVPSDQRKHG